MKRTTFPKLLRPKLLIRAARFALPRYRREVELPRILGSKPDGVNACLGKLLDVETGMEEERQSGDQKYSPSAHISVLTALLAEMSLVTEANPA